MQYLQVSNSHMTRDCMDPWKYAEISSRGMVRPCCNFPELVKLEPDCSDIHEALNNEKFQELRKSLLSGNLCDLCLHCHIRKATDISTLREKVEKEGMAAQQFDLLRPMRLSEIRIDINEKCNLRCDYCAVSSDTYNGVEMQQPIFDAVFDLLRKEKGAHVYLNGHGETTYHPNWLAWGKQIIDISVRPIITTNLAKPFSDDEIKLLAQFKTIQVSLDSHDPEMMKNIRKAVKVDHVFATIDRIREAAVASYLPHVPKITMSVGVYDPSIWTLEDFVKRLIKINIAGITFWNLVEIPHQRLVSPLRQLDESRKRRASEILFKVRSQLDRNFIPYDFAGDFDGLLPSSIASRVFQAILSVGLRLKRLANATANG